MTLPKIDFQEHVFNQHVNNAGDKAKQTMEIFAEQALKEIEKIEKETGGIMGIFHNKPNHSTLLYCLLVYCFKTEKPTNEKLIGFNKIEKQNQIKQLISDFEHFLECNSINNKIDNILSDKIFDKFLIIKRLLLQLFIILDNMEDVYNISNKHTSNMDEIFNVSHQALIDFYSNPF